VIEHPYYKASWIGWKNIFGNAGLLDSTQGFYPKDLSWDPNLDSVNRITRPIHIIIQKEMVDEYAKTLQQLKRENRKVVIVIPPIFKDGRMLLTNLDEFRSVLKQFEGNGVYLLDLSDMDITDSKTYFYNNSHVNRTGSVLLTRRIASFVRKVMAEQQASR
jgi:hypothetical protein